MLATNAHVVRGLHNKYAILGGEQANLRAIARFVGEQPRDIELDLANTTVHPGFDYFDEIISTHMVDYQRQVVGRSIPGGSADFFMVGSAFDVGLVPTKQVAGQPLTLAKENDLRGLDPGTEIAYIGYPLDGLIGARLNNPPEMHVGRLTSLVNFVSQADAFEKSLILTHSLPVVGGASGSPIFSRDGKVIGLISHGSITMADTSDGPTRIMLGFNYGQRVTMLRELLAQAPVKNAQHLREEEIQRQFDSLNMLPQEERALYRSGFAASNLLEHLKTTGQAAGNTTLNFAGQTRADGVWPAQEKGRTFTLDLTPGNYIVSAGTSSDFVFAIVFTDPSGQRHETYDNIGVSAQRYFFTVPANQGNRPVEYIISLDRSGTSGEDCFFAFNVIPVQ